MLNSRLSLLLTLYLCFPALSDNTCQSEPAPWHARLYNKLSSLSTTKKILNISSVTAGILFYLFFIKRTFFKNTKTIRIQCTNNTFKEMKEKNIPTLFLEIFKLYGQLKEKLKTSNQIGSIKSAKESTESIYSYPGDLQDLDMALSQEKNYKTNDEKIIFYITQLNFLHLAKTTMYAFPSNKEFMHQISQCEQKIVKTFLKKNLLTKQNYSEYKTGIVSDTIKIKLWCQLYSNNMFNAEMYSNIEAYNNIMVATVSRSKRADYLEKHVFFCCDDGYTELTTLYNGNFLYQCDKFNYSSDHNYIFGLSSENFSNGSLINEREEQSIRTLLVINTKTGTIDTLNLKAYTSLCDVINQEDYIIESSSFFTYAGGGHRIKSLFDGIIVKNMVGNQETIYPQLKYKREDKIEGDYLSYYLTPDFRNEDKCTINNHSLIPHVNLNLRENFPYWSFNLTKIQLNPQTALIIGTEGIFKHSKENIVEQIYAVPNTKKHVVTNNLIFFLSNKGHITYTINPKQIAPDDFLDDVSVYGNEQKNIVEIVTRNRFPNNFVTFKQLLFQKIYHCFFSDNFEETIDLLQRAFDAYRQTDQIAQNQCNINIPHCSFCDCTLLFATILGAADALKTGRFTRQQIQNRFTNLCYYLTEYTHLDYRIPFDTHYGTFQKRKTTHILSHAFGRTSENCPDSFFLDESKYFFTSEDEYKEFENNIKQKSFITTNCSNAYPDGHQIDW